MIIVILFVGAILLAILVFQSALQEQESESAVSEQVVAEEEEPAAKECGIERWPVKVFLDQDRERVDLAPRDTTIQELIALPRPAGELLDDRRMAPIELQEFRVRAVVLRVKLEQDSDLHLIIADPENLGIQMIAEVPHPDCALGSGQEEKYRHVRQALRATPIGTQVELIGLGFFDREHEQSGAAPNQIELHPVLAIQQMR